MSNAYLSEIRQGKLVLHPRFSDWAKRHEGRRVRIAPVSGSVSDQQRGYIFGAVIPFLRKLVPAWEKEHENVIYASLKVNFGPQFELYDPVQKKNVKISVSIASNAKSNHKRAEEFLTNIGDWVRENYGKELPDPEEYKHERDSAPLRSPLTPVRKEKTHV